MHQLIGTLVQLIINFNIGFETDEELRLWGN